MFGLDEIYESLLLEAKSPEEIKKILEYQFVQSKGVPQEVFDKVFNMDPTKKKTYTKWILMQWEKESKTILSALKHGTLKTMLDYFQERARTGLNLLSVGSFSEALDMVPQSDNDPIFKPIEPEEADYPENDYDVVYDSPEWKIAIPNTWQADEKLGVGCKWCTAGAYGDAKRYFDSYTRYGKLWVNFDKRQSEIAPLNHIEYPYTRYQFCFEYGTRGEMCDSRDDRADFEEMNIPESVVEFYTKQDPHYAEILSGEFDDDRVWERYEEERFEHAILRKEGFGGAELFFMPEYDEYDPHVSEDDGYQIYDYNDTTDSINGVVYPNKEEDIVDTCDGFAMLVMKSQDSKGYYDVFFEKRERRTWGGEHCGWTSLTEIPFYGGNEHVKFFFDSYDSEINFMRRGSSYEKNIDKMWLGGDDVSRVSALNFDGLSIGNNDGLFVLVEYDGDYYGLFYHSISESKVRTIIQKDRPANGVNFTIEKDERGFYTEGLLNRYYLGEDWTVSNSHALLHLEAKEYMEGDRDFMLVKYWDDRTESHYLGIYKISEKKFIIKDARQIKDFSEYAVIRTDSYSRLFNYCKEEWISEPFKHGNNKGFCGDFFSHDTIDNPNIEYLYDVYTEREHGPFDVIGDVLNRETGVVVVQPIGLDTNDGNRCALYCTETGQYLTDKRYIYVRKVNNGLCVGVRNGDEGCDLINTDTCKVVTQLRSSTLEPVGPEIPAYKRMFYTFQRPNKKFNIYSYKYGVVLPQDVEIILPWVADNLVPFKNNGHIYMLHIDDNDKLKMLPTKNGISCENLGSLNATKKLGSQSISHVAFEVTLGDSSRRYTVIYDVNTNTIKSVENAQTYYETGDKVVKDPEILRQVEQIFFPEKVQLSENFRKIMDRMNNL